MDGWWPVAQTSLLMSAISRKLGGACAVGPTGMARARGRRVELLLGTALLVLMFWTACGGGGRPYGRAARSVISVIAFA